MREDLLHFIWKYKKLELGNLVTSKNEKIQIVDFGTHNHLAGPDFFNAKVNIDGQLWAGNIEIHIKSSDWYAHGHEEDVNYDNVILHVVWQDDTSVFRKDSSEIPTLELKNYISETLLKRHQKLFDKKDVGFINCEKSIGDIDSFIVQNWLERLYFERLERKSNDVFKLLKQSNNDWEKVLFVLLLKNFGLKINGDSFMSIAQALDFSVVRKIRNESMALESVLFGLAGFLEDRTIVDSYYIELKKEFAFLNNKFDIQRTGIQKPEFFKLRPPNFPTIRLSQLTNLYAEHQNLFTEIIHTSSLDDMYKVFNIAASKYWNNHFTFGKESKKSRKRLTTKFIDLLIINTILPLKFCYAKHLGKDVNDEILDIISSIKREDNSVVDNFMKLGVDLKNAKDSQSILQLYNGYCVENRCLECAIGSSLLYGND
ncbi:FIG00650353: hypothetical protein [hydrothermal vent metagenome]|uniref:DUF2851 domain-containing protein n=1 Tax=hydrothermal vent metagenome TaxID=652676 RepID=A0A3B0T073_9ZZZZ